MGSRTNDFIGIATLLRSSSSFRTMSTRVAGQFVSGTFVPVRFVSIRCTSFHFLFSRFRKHFQLKRQNRSIRKWALNQNTIIIPFRNMMNNVFSINHVDNDFLFSFCFDVVIESLFIVTSRSIMSTTHNNGTSSSVLNKTRTSSDVPLFTCGLKFDKYDYEDKVRSTSFFNDRTVFFLFDRLDQLRTEFSEILGKFSSEKVESSSRGSGRFSDEISGFGILRELFDRSTRR